GVLDNVQTSEIKQLVDAGNAGFGAHDLLLVGEASANDTAALVTAYLNQYVLATDPTAFTALVASLLDSTTVANNPDPATLGTLYMNALADKLMAAVVTNALAKGATRVAILNTLDITQTPKLKAALASIAAASSQANADQVQALIRSWIGAYNDQLDADVVPYAANVAVVNFYTAFNADLNNPTANGLTNTTATVCDEIHTNGTAAGTTSLSDSGVVRECTDAAATAHAAPTPPASDGTANWWKSFLFADNFHPTPHGHDLLTAIVETRLRAVGWM
ncbi:MAG TPA: SGNH/GDSL hydrolase family protein, partial [Rhodocyclaceae bacterium]|nr:SGNH/GDSL hydrolase family protein [Rhodocyclaceae bacterium]